MLTDENFKIDSIENAKIKTTALKMKNFLVGLSGDWKGLRKESTSLEIGQ